MTKPMAPPPRRPDPPATPGNEPTPPPGAASPAAAQRRSDFALLDTTLQSFTGMWLASLPEAVKPVNCAEHYPRVLNKIAAMWSLNERCLDYLNDLVTDTRGDRQGFSYGVLGELRRLRTYRLSTGQNPQAADPADEAPTTDFMATVPMAPDAWPSKR